MTDLANAPGDTAPGSRSAGAEQGRGDRRPAITLDRVHKRFGSFAAVHDADFVIGEGEFFSLLGPSGCGKTTTLRMIAGFEVPSSGRILLGGQDVSRTPPYRRNVNTVFQQYALFPHLTVFDNVAFGLRSKKVPETDVRRRVAEMIEVVRLGEFAARKPAQLSGGQQQRVALARALVNHPTALLLDEPLGALDLKLRQTMQFELKRIQREVGITFVYVTHDQEEALTMSDRIAVMSQGYTEQIGTPVDIYHRPTTSFVAGFIGSANLLPVTITGKTDDHITLSSPGAGPVALPADGRSFPAGSSATLMIRPERLRVSTSAPPDPLPQGSGSIPARVTDLVFQGPVVRIAAAVADLPVVAHVGDDAELPLLRPGDEVWLTWLPGGAYLVADSAPETPSDVET